MSSSQVRGTFRFLALVIRDVIRGLGDVMSPAPEYGKQTKTEISVIESMHDTPERLRKQAADRARMAAAEAAGIASIEVIKFFLEIMRDSDADLQARIRAGDILLSRSVPKVAAKHALLGDDEVVDTVDVQAIRQSILDEVQKKGR